MAVDAASDALDRWLSSLDAESLRALIDDARRGVPDLADWLDTQRAASSDDPAELRAIVDRAFTPHRRFYDYWQANEYAAQTHDVVGLLAQRSLHATPGLIPVIERAITLTTRAILKSDDSSGAQGDVVRTLLDAHAAAVCTTTPALTQPEQTRLVKWIVKYRYDGKQDFFDPDIVAYAPGLSAKSIEQYRQAVAAIDLGEYGKYPLTRLAVLDRDRDAIVAANGGEPGNALVAARLVGDLAEAGLHTDAVAYARIGIAMDGRGWDQKLVTFLVDDAFTRADPEDAVALRRDWFHRFPSASAFASLRDTSSLANLWHRERAAAEALLEQRSPDAFITYLLGEDRVDEAWDFAIDGSSPASNASVWLNLAEKRALTHPADTLPIYREIITDTLTVTDKRNYRSAAKILKTMRVVAAAAGADFEFDSFLAETVEQNRRRPTCIEAFARAGLIART
ncbi:hypothetical protein [Microbacterium sp. CH12i]|uniref:hypothetical protein n=1 Tax=Microbacterium sp. CH12i TaxID=1479651 RepID=UPI000A566743|nr:hypothetical protein [Microbacterium sp. CH12i]